MDHYVLAMISTADIAVKQKSIWQEESLHEAG